MSFSRRNFLKIAGASTVGAAMVAPLEAYYARVAQGQVATGIGFGPLSPKVPVNTNFLVNNPAGDLSGVPLLDLPPGFNYKVLSSTGQQMVGGGITPADPDGMAAFQGPGNTTILVRNHELSLFANDYGYTDGVAAPVSKKYDAVATGGTTTLVVGPNNEVIREFGSLSGTIRNCAGGLTPWGSWISCEENVATPASDSRVSKKHGYNFEVPATSQPAFADPNPLIEMGRFNHEAIAVDPATGYVYETEDRNDSCFYRFVPNVGKPTKAGDLAKGGKLYALVVKGRPTLNTTNNPNFGGTIGSIAVGQTLAVEWVKIDEPDPAGDTLRFEAQGKGAAIFFRGEGMWYGNGLVYFTATQGGPPPVIGGNVRGKGQVWAYDPQRETVTLVVEAPPSGDVLDCPDNITVAPFGDLILCEDGPGDEFIVGVNSKGELYKFARQAYALPGSSPSEFAGACFSPDGRTMFVNNMDLGTYAIWGPWPRNRR